MDIVHMKTLIAVVEENGFTAAAARLGIAKSVCSRRITDLETDLGVQLVTRTTRSVMPTDLGREYYENCKDILNRIDAATEAAKGANSSISGRLRLSVPINYTFSVLAPKLDAFSLKHSDVALDLHLSDQRVDIISEGFDAAIRVGPLEDSGLFARKIGTTSSHAYAAPAYLDEFGMPRDFDDLSEHKCIRYSNLSSGSEWVATQNGKEIRKRVSGHFSSNSGTYNKRIAIAGRGIAVLPNFIVSDAIESGQLVPLFPDIKFEELDVNILYPNKVNMPASLRALINHLVEHT